MQADTPWGIILQSSNFFSLKYARKILATYAPQLAHKGKLWGICCKYLQSHQLSTFVDASLYTISCYIHVMLEHFIDRLDCTQENQCWYPIYSIINGLPNMASDWLPTGRQHCHQFIINSELKSVVIITDIDFNPSLPGSRWDESADNKLKNIFFNDNKWNNCIEMIFHFVILIILVNWWQCSNWLGAN